MPDVYKRQEYDTLDEFKASIRKNNQEQLDKQDDLAVENALVDQVIDSMEGEIPQAMYDERMDEMVNDFAFRVEQQGLRLEDYLKYMGQTVEQFRASFMPQAEKQVKIRLALEAVAAAENIEASEEEVSAEIKRIADQYKMEEDKVRELVNVDDLKMCIRDRSGRSDALVPHGLRRHPRISGAGVPKGACRPDHPALQPCLPRLRRKSSVRRSLL